MVGREPLEEMNMRRILPTMVLACIWAAPTLAIEVSVDLRTDLEPKVHFDYIHTSLEVRDTGQQLVSFDKYVYTGDDVFGGFRIGSFEMNVANHRMRVSLVDRHGEVVVSRVAEFNPDGNLGVTFVLTTPNAPDELVVTKTDELAFDADGDGEVGTGDTVRYDVSIVGPSPFPGEYTDGPGRDWHVVTGSVVTSSHGQVLAGNHSGDTQVAVAVGEVPEGESATISYEVRLEPRVVNQGFLSMVETLPPSALLTPVPIPSDDPGTPEPFDATVSAVDAIPLECLRTARELELELEGLEADVDADGVPAVADDCPGTIAGSVVDRLGCSVTQFCAGIQPVAETCNSADWQNDEPVSDSPMDCKLRGTLCRPR